jgi:ATP-binding cassette, subfamily B, multidrug efflux pump
MAEKPAGHILIECPNTIFHLYARDEGELSKIETFLRNIRGLDYVIEQGGRNLSGGQKQRLTIARAVVKDPEILILDDSASALDFATDARLRAALRNLQGNKTIFIVSQRTSSIQFADQILVMDDGQAVGLGTHEELLENCEIYREIYESQFKKEDLRKNGGAGNV